MKCAMTASCRFLSIRSLMGMLVWVALALLTGCVSCGKKEGDPLVISGQVSDMEGDVFLLEQNTFELTKIDSTKISGDGRFRFILHPEGTSIYAIQDGSGRQIVLIAAPGDSMAIQGSFRLIPQSVQVSGNQESTLLHSFYIRSASNRRKADSLRAVVMECQDDPGFYLLTLRVDSAFQEIWETQRMEEQRFIRDHAGTLASLLVVIYRFGMKPVLSVKDDRIYYQVVDSGLMASYPGNKHTWFFHRWLHEVK